MDRVAQVEEWLGPLDKGSPRAGPVPVRPWVTTEQGRLLDKCKGK
jgi:hypothetical protein